MRMFPMATSCSSAVGRWVYTLLVDDVEADGFQCESYGVSIRDLVTGESQQVRHVTQRPDQILTLLSTLACCVVTPTTLCDVVEDWMAQ